MLSCLILHVCSVRFRFFFRDPADDHEDVSFSSGMNREVPKYRKVILQRINEHVFEDPAALLSPLPDMRPLSDKSKDGCTRFFV